MTGTEVFLTTLCPLFCIMAFLAVCRLIIRDDPKNGKRLILMAILSLLYKVSGIIGIGFVVLCFIFPDRAGTLQISTAVIALLIHFGLFFVDGVKDFDKKHNRLAQ